MLSVEKPWAKSESTDHVREGGKRGREKLA